MALQNHNLAPSDKILNEQNADGSMSVSICVGGGPTLVAADAVAAANLWQAAKGIKELCDEPGVSVSVAFDDITHEIQSIVVTRTK